MTWEESFKKEIAVWEGNVPYMYVDRKGLVTTGTRRQPKVERAWANRTRG